MNVRSLRVREACGIVILAGAFACTKSGESASNVPPAQQRADGAPAAQEATTPALSAAAQVALDSGNALFRKTDYAAALVQYRLAAKESPETAAPFFGIYMAALKLKDRALADSAFAAMRERDVTRSLSRDDTAGQKAHAGMKSPGS